MGFQIVPMARPQPDAALALFRGYGSGSSRRARGGGLGAPPAPLLTGWVDGVRLDDLVEDFVKMPTRVQAARQEVQDQPHPPRGVPPDWFSELYGDLAFAKSRLVMAFAEAGRAPPPSPALPETAPGLAQHLAEARQLMDEVERLQLGFAALGLRDSPHAREALEALADHFVAADWLRVEARRDLAGTLRRLAAWLRPLREQTELASAFAGGGVAPDGVEDIRTDTAEAADPALQGLLEESGGALSVREAAEAAGVTRQAIHQRLQAGSLFGMRLAGRPYLLPRAQFQEGSRPLAPLPGLADIIALFREAGALGAPLLAFLARPHEGLGEAPASLLARGQIAPVRAAALAWLDLDDDTPPAPRQPKDPESG